jgi:hypothetical protein
MRRPAAWAANRRKRFSETDRCVSWADRPNQRDQVPRTWKPARSTGAAIDGKLGEHPANVVLGEELGSKKPVHHNDRVDISPSVGNFPLTPRSSRVALNG